MTVAETLAQACKRLAPVSDSPRLDAELLLAQVLDLPRSALFTRSDQFVDESAQCRYQDFLNRRADGMPVAYLLGTRGFWTLDLQVTPDVLVPRPETELLVEWALQVFGDREGRIADLGTGSGALALALASERARAQVVATDCSAAALRVARDNARRLGLEHTQFVQGSWFDALQGLFDLIVSNPPYVAAGDPHLRQLVHEPIDALTDHGDGLQCLREIVAKASAHLWPGAWLLVEHGYDQGAAVRELFDRAGFAQVQTRRDLGGHERATGGRRASA